mmetsp:Transcript_35094/g.139306  ORF Transcript_35094/g.139306 Transcript_35094/m.139306 type:complete len:111 (+) Transcript_35094:104-436(+)
MARKGGRLGHGTATRDVLAHQLSDKVKGRVAKLRKKAAMLVDSSEAKIRASKEQLRKKLLVVENLISQHRRLSEQVQRQVKTQKSFIKEEHARVATVLQQFEADIAELQS